MPHDILHLDKFPLGINTVSPETDLPEGSARSASNVDLTKEGNVRSRKGYAKVYAGVKALHSLYKSYFVEGDELKQWDGVTANTIAVGLHPDKFLAWETILGKFYYSDGVNNRIVGNGRWGLPTPAGNPILGLVTGKLAAGTYQVAICFVDSITGEIGGALLASTINAQDGSGILCANIPVHPEGYNVHVYVSTQNGEQLYKNGTVLNGITSYTIIDSRKSQQILETQFMSPLPGGHIIRQYNGRMYCAHDNVLWFSQPFRYGLKKTSKDFFQFPSKIKIVQPVDNGIFVVAGNTYFLSGREPKEFIQTLVSEDDGIEGTGLTLSGDSFGLGFDKNVGFWYSTKGAVVGLLSGELKLLTENRLALRDQLVRGISLYKEKEGIKQVVSNFSSGGTVSSFGIGTAVTSQLIRNGIIIL